jgi:hypothetical protein
LTRSELPRTRVTAEESWDSPPLSRLARRILGERGVSLLKRALGRTTPERVVQRKRVRVGSSPAPADHGVLTLVLTSVAGEIDPRADYPIEHLVSGASAAYQERRLALVGRYYDVVGED